ncbi:MAG TPA: hypothetical protein VF093_01160 [Solirubrobacterales bacterium]
MLVAIAFALAPVASASASEFEVEENPAVVSGEEVEGNHVLTLESEKPLSCEEVIFSGELGSPIETLEVTPQYENCTFAGNSATVDVNECAYEFHAGSESAEEVFEGTMDLVCPEGESISITGSTCKITLGHQSLTGKVEFTNELEAEPKATMTAEMSLSNVEYTKVEDGAFCPLNGIGPKEDGSYNGQELLKASKEEQDKGMAVGKVKGMLCEEKVKTGCKKAFKNGDEVKATQSSPIALTPKTGKSIICQAATVTAAIKDNTVMPEPLEKFIATFDQCKWNVTTDCAKVEMLNKNSEALVRNWGFLVGGGNITVPFTLFIECDKAVVKCEYESAAKNDMVFVLPGGDPSLLRAAELLVNKPLASKDDANCAANIVWTGDYSVEKPKPVYVAG